MASRNPMACDNSRGSKKGDKVRVLSADDSGVGSESNDADNLPDVSEDEHRTRIFYDEDYSEMEDVVINLTVDGLTASDIESLSEDSQDYLTRNYMENHQCFVVLKMLSEEELSKYGCASPDLKLRKTARVRKPNKRYQNSRDQTCSKRKQGKDHDSCNGQVGRKVPRREILNEVAAKNPIKNSRISSESDDSDNVFWFGDQPKNPSSCKLGNIDQLSQETEVMETNEELEDYMAEPVVQCYQQKSVDTLEAAGDSEAVSGKKSQGRSRKSKVRKTAGINGIDEKQQVVKKERRGRRSTKTSKSRENLNGATANQSKASNSKLSEYKLNHNNENLKSSSQDTVICCDIDVPEMAYEVEFSESAPKEVEKAIIPENTSIPTKEKNRTKKRMETSSQPVTPKTQKSKCRRSSRLKPSLSKGCDLEMNLNGDKENVRDVVKTIAQSSISKRNFSQPSVTKRAKIEEEFHDNWHVINYTYLKFHEKFRDEFLMKHKIEQEEKKRQEEEEARLRRPEPALPPYEQWTLENMLNLLYDPQNHLDELDTIRAVDDKRKIALNQVNSQLYEREQLLLRNGLSYMHDEVLVNHIVNQQRLLNLENSLRARVNNFQFHKWSPYIFLSIYDVDFSDVDSFLDQPD